MDIEIREKKGVKSIFINGKSIGTMRINDDIGTVEATRIIETIEAKSKAKGGTKKGYEDKNVKEVTINESRSIISITLDDGNALEINMIKGTISTENGIISKSYLASITGTLEQALSGKSKEKMEDTRYIYKLFSLCFHSSKSIANLKVGSVLSKITNRDIRLAEVFMDITDGLVDSKYEIGNIYELIDRKKITEKNKYSILKLLGISKEEMISAYKSDGSPYEDIQLIIKNRSLIKVIRDDYKELLLKDNSDYWSDKEKTIESYDLVDFIGELISKYDLNTRDALNYFSQKLPAQGFPIINMSENRDPLTSYRDYLEMSVNNMHRKNIDFYPNNMLTVHHIMAVNTKIRLDEGMAEKFKKLDLQGYEYKDKLFGIIAPRSPQALISEGQELSHCVGNYIDMMLKRKTVIVFLRDLEDISKSFYTIEVINNVVVQVKGKINRGPTKEVIDIITRYNKFLRKKDNEDKKIEEEKKRELANNSA